MRMKLSFKYGFVPIAFIVLTSNAFAQPRPAVEYSSLLDSVSVYHKGATLDEGGGLSIQGAHVAFLPKPDQWEAGDPSRSGGHFLDAVLSKDGKDLVRIHFDVSPREGVFSWARPRGVDWFRFKEPGSYKLTYVVDGQPITVLPFEVFFKQGDDPFNPQKYTYTNGPWNHWSYIHTSTNEGDSSAVDFRLWMRRLAEDSSGQEKIQLEVIHKGEVVAEASPSVVSNPLWSRMNFSLLFRKDQGGNQFPLKRLVSQDGDYLFVVRRGEDVHAAFNARVTDGKLTPHPREKIGYEPHSDYLVGRRMEPRGSNFAPGEVYWMEALSDADIEKALSSGPTAAKEVDDSTRAGWLVPSTIDTGRAFSIKTTNIPLRHDGALAVSDDIIAYGTGGFAGVEYLKVGEDRPNSIPDGNKFIAKFVWVCGKKIILVQSNQIYVYDTGTETMFPISPDDVTLPRAVGGPGQPNIMFADGFLFACVCDEKKVQDRASIKVIDVSANEPRVLSIRTNGVVGKKVTSITVDAKCAKVAFGLKQDSILGIADVAPGAIAEIVDISAYDSIGDEQLYLGEGRLLYADGSSARRIRVMDIATKEMGVFGQEGAGAKGISYRLVGDYFAYAVSPGNGSNYPFLVGTLSGGVKSVPGTGDNGEGNCQLGFGSRSAQAPDGTVFICGDGNIGSGEVLQAYVDGKWSVVKDVEGNPIPGVDPVIGGHTLGFKTGKSTKTFLGYATFGVKISGT